jgi:Xaa-Pro aminopeptidase
MTIDTVLTDAREHLASEGIDGWLLYDYRGMNPIFWDTVGAIANVTRPCWLWVPSQGEPRLLLSYVDRGRFSHMGIDAVVFVSRGEMVARLRELLRGVGCVAMEYSPQGGLPRVSRVDAGTLELVRGLGVEVVPSADTVQYATQRWSEAQLVSHTEAAAKLGVIVHAAFRSVGENLGSGVTEHDVAGMIRSMFVEGGLQVTDGPVVAVNEHSSDPHYEPTAESSAPIGPGDWLLIDLWSRLDGDDTMFADITWTAYVGDLVPEQHQRVFDAVIGSRDAAVDAIEAAFASGRELQGWEVDRVARDYISGAGYGDYFSHRLGHSLGREVHGNAVNLDGWETHDTRKLVSGIAVTIEPGVYLPEFGVRSEIDVYISESGPQVTTEVQRSVVLISG